MAQGHSGLLSVICGHNDMSRLDKVGFAGGCDGGQHSSAVSIECSYNKFRNRENLLTIDNINIVVRWW